MLAGSEDEEAMAMPKSPTERRVTSPLRCVANPRLKAVPGRANLLGRPPSPRSSQPHSIDRCSRILPPSGSLAIATRYQCERVSSL